MSLKVFIPSSNKNSYLDQIIIHSSLDFVVKPYKNYKSTFGIVNIHWPEAIFDWKEPSLKELKDLNQEIESWKHNSIIVYTKHDWGRVKGWTKNFKILFQLIEENADVFVHLGLYSKNYYTKKYPKKVHRIIPHPTFENSFELVCKKEAREQLGIDPNALVITAPGQIRSKTERDLLLKSFKNFNHQNKVLISTNMRNEMEWNFPGRIRFQKIFNIKAFIKGNFEKKHQPPQYLFTYAPQGKYDFAIRIAAADLLFVPRTNILNTGNVLLGLTFNKITIGPAIGNIKEQLEEHNFPVFDPKSISSAVKAMEKGFQLFSQGFNPVAHKKYQASNVSKAYDKLFKELLTNES